MKKSIILLTAAVMTFTAGSCREQLQSEPPPLKGDDMIIAVALRKHMNVYRLNTGADLQYIFITVLGKDPGNDFLDYFDDLFPQVLPGSEMKRTSEGFEGLPMARGVWVLFDVTSLDRVSDDEAVAGIRTVEPQKELPVVSYRLKMKDGRWTETSVTGVGEERILD
jgi:hypothetical protein